MKEQPKITPPLLPEELQARYNEVAARFEAAWPAPQPTNSPNGAYVKSCLLFVGGTVDAVAAAIDTLTGYFGNKGTPQSNASARYAAWGDKHGQVEELLLNVFKWGVALPPREQVNPPPLKATFSEAAIQARVNLTPFPQRYDGAPCFSDPQWFGNAADALAKVLANPAWDIVPYATKRALALSLWLPGQPYAPAQGYNPSMVEGMTAAQIFRIFDVATLPGVQATP